MILEYYFHSQIHFESLKLYFLHFSKHRRLSIQSSSMRIKFQLLPLILVVAVVGVSLDTISYSAVDSFCSSSASSSSRYFLLFYFYQSIPIFIEQNIIIFVICFHLFRRVHYVFFVTLISSFSSYQFCEWSWLVFPRRFFE